MSTGNSLEVIQKAIDMLCNYCAENDIILQGTLVFEDQEQSYIEQINTNIDAEEGYFYNN